MNKQEDKWSWNGEKTILAPPKYIQNDLSEEKSSLFDNYLIFHEDAAETTDDIDFTVY